MLARYGGCIQVLMKFSGLGGPHCGAVRPSTGKHGHVGHEGGSENAMMRGKYLRLVTVWAIKHRKSVHIFALAIIAQAS